MQRKQLLAVAALLLVAGAAFADVPNVDNVVKNFEIASNGVSSKLVVFAKQTAVAAVLLQWIIGYSKEIFGNHEAKDYLGKGIMMISWFGATIWLIDHVDLISVLFKKYGELASYISGVSAGDFTPWGVIRKGRDVIDTTHAGIAAKLGEKWFAFGQNFLASATLLVVDIIVMAAFMILGLSLFVVHVEFWLIFAVTPLALALIPLSALRDQGIAPLKGLISVGLRVLILGVIIAVANSLSTTLIDSISAHGIPGDPESQSVLARMMEYLAGMLGCAAMAIYAGKIASAIASGSASFTGADAMSAGGAMVAGGAAMAAGAALAGGAAVKAGGGAKALSGAASNAMERAAANPFVTPSGGGAAGGGNSGGNASRASHSGAANQGAGTSGAGTAGASNAGGVNSGADTPEASNAPDSIGGGADSGASASGASSGGAGDQGEANSGGSGFGQPLQSQPPSASNAPASIGGGADSGASNWEKFNRSSNRLTDNLMRDQANVSVQVNLGAEK